MNRDSGIEQQLKILFALFIARGKRTSLSDNQQSHSLESIYFFSKLSKPSLNATFFFPLSYIFFTNLAQSSKGRTKVYSRYLCIYNFKKRYIVNVFSFWGKDVVDIKRKNIYVLVGKCKIMATCSFS